MTPSQKARVSALRDRFVKRREVALSEWQFAADVEFKAWTNSKAASEEWHALDKLVNAPDVTLLAIVEAAV